MNSLAHGIYERLLDEALQEALALRPELRRVFSKIDPEEQPALYASFVAKVLEQALREESDPEQRLALCNRLLGTVAAEPGKSHLQNRRLISESKPLLLEITPPNQSNRPSASPYLAGRKLPLYRFTSGTPTGP